GGLFKQSMGQMNAPVNPFINTAMGETIQKWLESTGFAPKQKAAPEPTIFDNPFTQAMQQMFGMQKPEAEKTVTNPFFDNPFAKAFQEMMGSLGKPVEPKRAEAPKEHGSDLRDLYAEGALHSPEGIKKPGDGWEAGHRVRGRAIGYHPAGKNWA